MRRWIHHLLCLSLWLGTCVAFAEVPSVAALPTQDREVIALPAEDSAVPALDEAEAQVPQHIEVPVLKSPVTDLTGSLDSDWIAAMQQRLLALQQRKGSQIAILMLPSTGEDSIEQFATRVFEQWRLGRQSVDDGVLVLVAKDDRTMRIEVGYGLEGAIPDVSAGRIIQEYMVPAFRSGDFAGGIEQAVDTLERLIDGEALPEQQRPSRGLTYEGWLLLIALIGGGVAGIVLRRRWVGVKIVLPVLVVGAVLMAASGLKSALGLLFALPFDMLVGAGIGALAAGSRKSAWIVGGIIGYLVALILIASTFAVDGGDVALYGLAAPMGGAIGLVFLCLPLFLAYSTWKRSRLEFGIRLAIALAMAGFVVHVSEVLQQPWELPDSLVLLPMLFFPMLFAFLPGGSSGSGSSGSGSSSSGGSSSSSSGSSYSGGGGSSGGGGASGSW
ncbi:TPM domain-containing protein [Pseudomonas nicosulfuronedens]